MRNRIGWRLIGAGAVGLGWALALPAGAQTAADINRLNAAMQICASPAGAALAECAQLRGALAGTPLAGQALGAQAGGMVTVQAAQAYRLCVAANPNNYAVCQAALTAQSLPGAGAAPAAPAAPPPKPAAPLDPLAGLLGR